jgi:hypothetical protein
MSVLTPVSWSTDVPAFQQQVKKYINYSTPTRVISTASQTLTARQVIDSFNYPIVYTNVTTQAFPTGTTLVNACRSPAVNSIIIGRFINLSGSAITFAASTGVTYSSAFTALATNNGSTFACIFTNVTDTPAYTVVPL